MSPRKARKAFDSEQSARLAALTAADVSSWRGTPFPITDDDDGVLRNDAGEPVVIQLDRLTLERPNAGPLQVSTHQDDLEWGLLLTADASVAPSSPDALRGDTPLAGLPAGRPTDIRTCYSSIGNLWRIDMRFRETEIVLVAGAAYEDWEGEIDFAPHDESVLLFPRLEEVARVRWRVPLEA